MIILGISCYYHDSAAALIKDGVVLACGEEERFSRKKHDSSFPERAINYCLEEAKISLKDVDYVVFYEKPILKLDRVLSSTLQYFPHSLGFFLEAMPPLLYEKLRIHSKIRKLGFKNKILYIKHHESHAASAFYASPFESAAIITVDGVGEWTTTTYGYGEGNNINILKEIKFPYSLGLFYSTVTSFLGFRINNDEYKVMGLSAYGNPVYAEDFRKILNVDANNGCIKMDLSYFEYPYKLRMYSKKFIEKFGEPRKNSEELRKRHKDIAASLQLVTNEVLQKMANYVHEQTNKDNLCLAGGVALNCIATGNILRNTECDILCGLKSAASDELEEGKLLHSHIFPCDFFCGSSHRILEVAAAPEVPFWVPQAEVLIGPE